ncbi:MAG: hypothetical protein WCR20_22340, partial [Verrucomicrobiota bacterium]
LEIGGDINLNGYKAATVTGRVMTAFNRVMNGTFFGNAAGWTLADQEPSAGYPGWVYDGTMSYTAWGGCAALVSTRSDSSYEYGVLSQPFTCPPNTGTVLLELYTQLYSDIYDANGYITALICNPNTGASITTTWTYAAGTNSWTARSWDISSIVSGGGDFILRLDSRIRTNNAGSKMLVDNVKLIL